MCHETDESKVILNYDNIPGMEIRYPQAVIQPCETGKSKPKYYMADTVVMRDRIGLSGSQLCAMAKAAAPLARKLVVIGKPMDRSRETKKCEYAFVH